MSSNVTLTLSEELYQRAEHFARQRRQSITIALADYLEAHLPPSQETLRTLPLSPDPLVAREQRVYRHLHPQLWQRYRNQYVALYEGELVDHDSDKVALFARIDTRYPNQFVLMRRVTEQPERELRFPSLRAVERPL